MALSGREAGRTARTGDSVRVSVEVQNTGNRAGDEVVPLYVTDEEASVPVRTLVGFQRLTLAAGERRTVTFGVAPRALSLINEAGVRVIEAGNFRFSVGGKQPGFTGVVDATTTGVLMATLEVTAAAPPP
jgi:beta-glucosidase